MQWDYLEHQYAGLVRSQRRRAQGSSAGQRVAPGPHAAVQQAGSSSGSALGNRDAAKEGDAQLSKQMKVLELKLDKALTQFNEALARNKTLREDIDNLRLERLNFDTVYRKMEKELAAKKREMADIIEISNVSYEARDQAHNEIASLRAANDREAARFEEEYRELGEMLEHDREMKMVAMRNKLRAAELGIELGEDGEESKLKVSPPLYFRAFYASE